MKKMMSAKNRRLKSKHKQTLTAHEEANMATFKFDENQQNQFNNWIIIVQMFQVTYESNGKTTLSQTTSCLSQAC